MTFLTRTTAGLALLAFALAPTADAQQARSDQDVPGVRSIERHVSSLPSTPGADQDIPGTRSTEAARGPVRFVSDSDDASMPLAPPSTEPSSARLDMGRELPTVSRSSQTAESNPFPNGRNLPAVVAKASAAGPRTITVDGRPLGSQPGTPVADDVVDAPEAPLAKAGDADSGVELSSSAPNPVVRTARITFTLPTDATASLRLFDVRGREVATLFEGAAHAGTHMATLDASALAAGTYVYVLDVAGERISRRLQVVR